MFKLAVIPIRITAAGLKFPKNGFLSFILMPYIVLRMVLLIAAGLLSIAFLGVLLIVAAVLYFPMVLMTLTTTSATLETGTELPDRLLQLDGEGRSGSSYPGSGGHGLENCASELLGILHRSYETLDPDSLRPVTTDGFASVQRMLQGWRRRQGVERVWEPQSIEATVRSQQVQGAAQSAVVDLRVRGRCLERLAGTDTILRGSLEEREWAETLQLRRSSSFAAVESTIASTSECANCGAALKLSEDGSCMSCGRLVAARADQWVISDHLTGAW